MPLQPGTTLGSYQVTAKIGEGGMGEVYRARDTKLNRQVALKILPEAFASDPDRLARFQREAQVLASLNHPNIAAIHGIEETDDTRALVLELVEGPTLADRIAQGPIPVDEALPIAKQIAEALEAAHEAGVIHRDLKPANIKVRQDGTVKVLDFGLAKALDTTPEGDPSQSPTLTAAATQMGVILGTAAYMSPEQARGLPVDKRADVWAFGVVLYEMLTGKRPFQGEDVSLTLASVMKSDVNVTVLPADLPETLRTVIRQCLQKDPKRRIRDVGDVSLAMDGAFESAVRAPAQPVIIAPRLQLWQRPIPLALTGLALLLLGGLAAGVLLGRSDQPFSSPTRFTVALQDSDRISAFGTDVALSPDGQTLVYRATRNGVLQFFRRPIDEFEAAPMQGTEDGSSPFFSPDGQWVGFSDGDALLTIALAGGPAQTLTALPNHIRGADWGVDEMIVFGLSMPGGELMQIPSAGGEPKPLFTPDDERESWYPQVLAGGEAVLFTLSGPRPDAGELHLVMPETGEDRTLLPNAVAGRVLDSGHLVFVRSGALWAVPFDSDRLDIVGNPLPVVNDVGVGLFGAAKHALADDGTLVYVPSNTATVGRRELVWVERDGREEPIAVPVRDYVNVSLSPDGTRAAFGLANDSGNVDIWTSELARGSLSRLTTHEAGDGYPLWGPGGLRVAFASNRNGPFEVFWQIEDGSEDAERLVAIESESVIPFDWSPDGTTLFAVATLPGTGRDVGRGSVEEPGSWEPLIQSAANEWWPKISPNGQWLAYTSDETGRNEVYVLRFPALENRRPISVGGGHAPSWSADGRELFYLRAPTGGAPDALMRVAIDIDEAEPPSLIPGTPERLFDWQYYWDPGFQFYQIAPDGQRFLMITTGADSGGSEINIVLNWHQELLERVPIP